MRNLRVKAQSESGFTLVELLVVMLILAILAAIAIPSFFNQRDKAKDSDAKADARTAQTALETLSTDNNGEYLKNGLAVTAADLQDVEEALAGVVTDGRLAVATTADTYTITVTSTSDAAQQFRIVRAAAGSVTFECDVDGEGGCPDNGLWAQ